MTFLLLRQHAICHLVWTFVLEKCPSSIEIWWYPTYQSTWCYIQSGYHDINLSDKSLQKLFTPSRSWSWNMWLIMLSHVTGINTFDQPLLYGGRPSLSHSTVQNLVLRHGRLNMQMSFLSTLCYSLNHRHTTQNSCYISSVMTWYDDDDRRYYRSRYTSHPASQLCHTDRQNICIKQNN